MLTRTKTVLLALMLTLALATGITSSAQAGKGMEIAVQDDPVLFQGLYSTPQVGIGLAEKLHASRIRVNVVWSYVVGRKAAKARKKPKRLKFNWSGYDLLIANAAPSGIKVQLVLTGPAPAWATGNHKVGPDRPKAKYFKEFASAAAKHFKGRVDRYSIWNEPNHRAWISPIKSGPKLYRALYLAGYSAIKRADHGAQVLMGETSPFALGHGRNAMAPLKFLRGVTCANKRYKRAKHCGTLKTDGYAHHPYDFDHKPTYRYPGKDNVTIGVLSRLTSALSKLRKAKLLQTPTGGVPFVYLTEYGYFSSGKRRMAESKKAKYLVQAFTIAQKNSRVKQMLHYLLLQPPNGRFRFFDTSIASRRGTPTRAFKALAKWADAAAKAGRIALATRVANGPSQTPPSGGGTSEPPPSGGGGGQPPPPPDNCTVIAGTPVCP
jgi:hypothetical protein